MRETDGRCRRRRWRSLQVWHRRIGVSAAALVLIAAVTGILLNHGQALGLAERTLASPWLLDWYGVAPKAEPVAFRAGGAWMAWLDGRLYLNGERVAERVGRPAGAVAAADLLAFASADELLLFARDGALIERLADGSLPGRIVAIGESADGRIVLRTHARSYRADAAVVTWEATTGDAAWAAAAPLPEMVRARLLAAERGRGLPLDRILLDLHSGRILGPWGPYLMDGAALCLLVLAATGLYGWLRNRR